MGLRWSQNNVSPIGIDFGADSIKLLQLVTEDPPQLVAAAQRDIPEAARKQSDSYYQFAASALREMVRDVKVKTKRVVASISAAQTYVQHVRLPVGDGEIVQQQLEMELRGRLPMDPLSMVVRHVDVGQVFSDGTAKQEVICLAASRESVMRSVKAIRQAGLDVVGMHCEPMAILAAFSHLFRREGDEKRTTFFIDVGGATTKALIAHGTKLVFAKTIHVAGDHFTRQMAHAWNVEPTEARHRRIQEAGEEGAQASTGEPEATPEPVAEPTPDRRQGAGVPGMAALNAAMEASDNGSSAATQTAVAPAATPRPAQAAEGEGEMLEALIDELQLCAGYHASMFPDRPIEKVVFLGGESRHVKMCQRIARALRVPAQVADPMARIVKPRTAAATGMDLREPMPGWAVPVGLCTLPTNL